MAEQWFELEIQRLGRLPMRKVFKAESLDAATAQAQRQYRDAVVQVPPQAARPTLARSHTSRSVLENLRYKRSQQA